MDTTRTRLSVVAVLAALVVTACGGSGDDLVLDPGAPVDDPSTSEPNDSSDVEDDPSDEPSGVPVGDDVLTLTGAITDERSETSADIRMRDVGACMGEEFVVGTFVDVGEGAEAETLYTVGGTAEKGTVDLDTTGEIPVTIELVALNDIMDTSDDVRYDGSGVVDLVRQEIVERDDAYAETEFVLTGTVTSRDGDTVDVRLDATAPFACTGF